MEKQAFQSTRPSRGATQGGRCCVRILRFQSTRPSRGATRKCRRIFNTSPHISIHAPLAGRDRYCAASRSSRLNFNPRAPRGARPAGRWNDLACAGHFNPRAPRGARRYSVSTASEPSLFQSTRPSRGATNVTLFAPCATIYFNPRAPRGARPTSTGSGKQRADFNPRAPRGARQNNPPDPKGHGGFQSTRPSRGATSGSNS